MVTIVDVLCTDLSPKATEHRKKSVEKFDFFFLFRSALIESSFFHHLAQSP
jgi:hypothetical protein